MFMSFIATRLMNKQKKKLRKLDHSWSASAMVSGSFLSLVSGSRNMMHAHANPVPPNTYDGSIGVI